MKCNRKFLFKLCEKNCQMKTGNLSYPMNAQTKNYDIFTMNRDYTNITFTGSMAPTDGAIKNVECSDFKKS